MSGSAEDRRLELERKKQKLAEMRESRRRAEEERKRQLLSAPTENGTTGRATLSSSEVHDILNEVGISSEPVVPQQKTPPRNGNVESLASASPMAAQLMSSSRVANLEVCDVQTIAIPVKDMASYCKTTQTDDEKFSVGEFSLGSQEFDYDEDMMDGLKAHDEMHFDGSPTEDLASLLPGFAFANKHHEHQSAADAAAAVEAEAATVPLSEDEKAVIVSSEPFRLFFDRASKVLERALCETASGVDVFVDYTSTGQQEQVSSGERLSRARRFEDDKWTKGRAVTAVAFSEQHPELMAVAYDRNEDAPHEPTGVVLIWNTKFKKTSPEYVFHCQSRLTSVAFARFHGHLVVAGCYTGQICLWDFRVGNKKTPVNKSPLSTSAHTHPVYCLQVVGSHNAHNLVSISTDGKLCSWNVDNVAQPVDAKELLNKAGKPIPILCMSFPVNEVNEVVVGSEDGNAYALSRHGTATAAHAAAHEHAHAEFEVHRAPVSGVSFHRATGPVDLSHLFLTASLDWTVKLWSTKDTVLRFSFEAHSDFVFDVAWSPVHPAVFASIDVEDNLLLWNLNEDTENPVQRVRVCEEESDLPTARTYMRRVVWSENGSHVCIGDHTGVAHLFNVHDSLWSGVRPDEWTKLARVLADMKIANEEAEEASEALSKVGGASVGGASVAAAAALGMSSPRQQNWN